MGIWAREVYNASTEYLEDRDYTSFHRKLQFCHFDFRFSKIIKWFLKKDMIFIWAPWFLEKIFGFRWISMYYRQYGAGWIALNLKIRISVWGWTDLFYLIRINFRAYLFSWTLAARNLKIFARIFFSRTLNFDNFRADLISRTPTKRILKSSWIVNPAKRGLFWNLKRGGPIWPLPYFG